MQDRAPVALVTGASRGIGRVVAAELALAGYRVAAVATSMADAAEFDGPAGVVPYRLDITDPEAVQATVETVEDDLGPVDLLVNNAARCGPSAVYSWEQSATDWWRVLEVNLMGTFLCCRAVMPSMAARRAGRIVNVSSVGAFFPLRYEDKAAVIPSDYMVSKSAVFRLTEALAAEGDAFGIRVFTVQPGTVKTDMTAEPLKDLWDNPDVWSPPELMAELIRYIGTGALDELTGRYIDAADESWRTIATRAGAIVDGDFLALRMRSEG